MRRASRTLLAFLLTASVHSPAAAADILRLAEFVRPAYIAMNITVLCVRTDPAFLSDINGPRGTPFHYAQHVKDEAIEWLNEADALAVLKLAADDAQIEARNKLYELARPGDDTATLKAMKTWCDEEGKGMILSFIRNHDDTHLSIELFLDQAKR